LEKLFDLFQSLLVFRATSINVSTRNEVPAALAAAGGCCCSARVPLHLIDRELRRKENSKPPGVLREGGAASPEGRGKDLEKWTRGWCLSVCVCQPRRKRSNC
jgi:hypothetical protein